ncbi:MAG TPA: ATP-binding protein [Casimicrobiaceae bacterium]|nr:ATP-binding protein [Casimicrobiaceae bacterium]
MSQRADERSEHRLLILAPTPRDSDYTRAMLHDVGIAATVCPNFTSLIREMGLGVGAVLIAEEALTEGLEQLASMLDSQPSWSDLPIMLITQHGTDSPRAIQAVDALGNVTLVERPIRVAALISTVRTALRARARQYETRAHLAALEEADRRKDEFLAVLAHELRNPLAPIRNSVQILRLTGGGGAVGKLSEIMDRQVTHMVRLVDDLLEISRITRGKVDLRKEPTSIAAVIEAAIETSRPLIESGKHDLQVHLPSTDITLEADGMRLAQVFANLLNNSAKYTEPGGTIVIDARREGDTVVVKVSDSGIGISEALLPHVFDMFSQAESAHRYAQRGLGIGLTLVRSLVQMHAGTVEASSQGAGKGSVFTVRLPLTASSGPSWLPSPQVVELHGVKAPMRILVVDDNREAADSLGMLLRVLGAEIEIAHGGGEALHACEKYQPALAFLDLGMPEMDGYEVARRIRAMPFGGSVTLVALSGWGRGTDRRRAIEAGFDHHLVKPADMGALRAVLAAATDRATPIAS